MKSSILLPLAQLSEQVLRSVQPVRAVFVARCIIQLLTKNPWKGTISCASFKPANGTYISTTHRRFFACGW